MDYTKIIDYSSMSTYIDCPRKFLFQYIMHLRSSHKSIHLVFGSCWHYGLEEAYKAIKAANEAGATSLNPSELTHISVTAFNLLWVIEGEPHFPDPDAIYPKSPARAADMYHAYWKEFAETDSKLEIIAVESLCHLSLSENDPDLPDYYGKIDLVALNPDGFLEIYDHKTAKMVNAVSLTGYEASIQALGYLTIANLYFDKIPKMIYNIALCQKSKIAFIRHEFTRQKSIIERFLSDAIFWSHRILDDLQIMQEEASVTARTFNPTCFKRSPGYACTMYFSACPYFDICQMRNNPLLWLNNPPPGYDVNEWDPIQEDARIKKLIQEAV